MTRATVLSALALLACRGEPATTAHDPLWELQISGALSAKGRGPSANTRATNATSSTRTLTVVFAADVCESDFYLKITNHHGMPVYDGVVTCDTIVVPVPAKQFADILVYGRGGYAYAVTLR
ncbi:MAG: hypothetical protein H6Q90_4646 [Deltaproteobacteria bacterium]|nr:hypothetical protein [Deltaproteobacteria bacterium]